MPGNSKAYQIVVWGATGFTGFLVAEYFTRNYLGKVKFAIAGRNETKLENVKQRLSLIDNVANSLDVIIADAHDFNSLENLVKQTQVVISCTGPYFLHGSNVVRACAENGVHYCDISAEPNFIRKMIRNYGMLAKENNSMIVHCCGFDCVPFDMGTYLLCKEMKQQYGKQAKYITSGLRSFVGGLSGGTIASLMDVLDLSYDEIKIYTNPYCLNDDIIENKKYIEPLSGKDYFSPYFSKPLNGYMSFFIMTAINSRIVHRSASIYGPKSCYGHDIQYKEGIYNGKGFLGIIRCVIGTIAVIFGAIFLSFSFVRKFLRKFILPAQGSGPPRYFMENGFWEVVMSAEDEDKSTLLNLKINGFEDPGYMGTAKMLSEAAVCLLKPSLPGRAGGILTPASAFGDVYIHRLRQAGFTYEIHNNECKSTKAK